MRDYITEKVKNNTRYFKFGNIDVEEIEPCPDSVNLPAVFKTIEDHLPSHYFQGLKGVKIGTFAEFETRDANAFYDDGVFYISNKQNNSEDILDDMVHEFAHHLETLYPHEIYEDDRVVHEFLKKRQELEFELRSEGYWTSDYNFDNLDYDERLDKFLYKRVGPQMLRMVTVGSFIRPYASVSLREYFATGFEAYYLGKKEELEKSSPMLYDKINELHHQQNY